MRTSAQWAVGSAQVSSAQFAVRSAQWLDGNDSLRTAHCALPTAH